MIVSVNHGKKGLFVNKLRMTQKEHPAVKPEVMLQLFLYYAGKRLSNKCEENCIDGFENS